ncbi:MAG: PilT/PilU family type 4a pilus ATPase [Candidatus Peregrinibacteria bacterium]
MDSTPHSDLVQAIDQATAPVSVQPKVILDQLVNLCIEREASDIHFGEGSRVALRVQGKIVFVENIQTLSHEEMEAMVGQMLTSPDEHKRLERVRELDFSYTNNNGVSFRVNVFYQRGKLSAVMRMISKHIPPLEQLGVPEVIKNLLGLRQGLILVTGNTGSGKSTTIQAMLEYLNENFVEHIITIENPIEHVFADKKSIFTQRELGKDTLTIPNGLQAAIRQDPNVIMVSEVSDFEALDGVLRVAETGHLVIASMLTKNVVQTLERMIAMFPQAQHEQAQNRIADNLIAVLSQALVDRADGAGRVAVCELLINSQNIPNLLRHGNISQIPTALQGGRSEGMVTREASAAELAEQGVISQEVAAQFAAND